MGASGSKGDSQNVIDQEKLKELAKQRLKSQLNSKGQGSQGSEESEEEEEEEESGTEDEESEEDDDDPLKRHIRAKKRASMASEMKVTEDPTIREEDEEKEEDEPDSDVVNEEDIPEPLEEPVIKT